MDRARGVGQRGRVTGGTQRAELDRDTVAAVVIAKAPEPGRSKTRLSPPCSPSQCAAVAAAALRDTLAVVARARVGRRVLVLDGAVPSWVGDDFEVVPQRGAGLDERLAAAFTDVAGPAILVGMDTPQLTAGRVEDLVDRLCDPDVDVVLGPALDGGYWTIGIREPDERVFVGVPMSRPDTCAAQLERLSELGLATALAPTMRDVDRFDDARAVAEAVPGGRFAAAVRAVERSLATSAPAGAERATSRP